MISTDLNNVIESRHDVSIIDTNQKDNLISQHFYFINMCLTVGGYFEIKYNEGVYDSKAVCTHFHLFYWATHY